MRKDRVIHDNFDEICADFDARYLPPIECPHCGSSACVPSTLAEGSDLMYCKACDTAFYSKTSPEDVKPVWIPEWHGYYYRAEQYKALDP